MCRRSPPATAWPRIGQPGRAPERQWCRRGVTVGKFNMCKDKPGGPKGDPFLTIRRVADELGISERSVWRLIEDGDLPAHKFGSSTRIRRSDLDDYIKRSRREPPRDPHDEDDNDGGETP